MADELPGSDREAERGGTGCPGDLRPGCGRSPRSAIGPPDALLAVPPGAPFTIGDAIFVRTKNATTAAARDEQGALRHFGQAEHRAFWAWAAVEFLRHTGARIEEMLEISHHTMLQYRLPTTGEIVPLLQIAPSKTDQERVVLVSPELAVVLATIIRRVRDPRTGAIPLLSAYDYEERVWNPPSPLLFQWDRGGERSRMSGEFIRSALGEVIAFVGLTDSTGQPLVFAPHDFRRLFITDAIRSGLPPHIAQVIAGHANINTTMGYNAIYPEETIEAHRAFITRRRALRPAEEYRTPTDAEWEDFGITNLLDAAITSVLVPVWARESGNGPTAIGLMGSVMGAAGVAGSLIAAVVAHRLRRRVVVLTGFLLAGAPRFLILAFDAPLVVVLTVFEVSGFGGSGSSHPDGALLRDLL